MTEKYIILCEPQCWGFEHARFNTAFLMTVLLAYPKSNLLFLAEGQHIQWVRQELHNMSDELMARVRWQEIAIPPRHRSGWKRLPHEILWCREVLKASIAFNTQALVVCSLTPPGLFVLKMMLFGRRRSLPTVAIPHSVLGFLETPRQHGSWFFSLGQLFSGPHPPRLRYIALGKSIYRHLAMIQSAIAQHFRPLDHPYLWVENELPNVLDDSDISFAYFGFGSKEKGIDAFYQLAKATQAQKLDARFVLVGFMSPEIALDSYAQLIEGVSYQPLTTSEYQKRARDIRYVLWTGSRQHYRLTASASFLDALSYIKPGIYLRNPYISHYFEQLGDIGYLCDSYEEMERVVRSLCQEFPRQRYQQQCQNILQGRQIFEPQKLAPQLQKIISL